MMTRRTTYWVLPAMAALCALTVFGCSGGGTAPIDTDFVEGVVTLDGNPVPEATVTFVPVNEGQGMSATGRTDAEGKYTLTAVGGGQLAGEAGAGTLEGEYYVGVLKSEMEVPLSQEEVEESGQEFQQSSQPSDPKLTHVVPQKYNNPRKSGLKKTVKKGQNSIPIELSSQ